MLVIQRFLPEYLILCMFLFLLFTSAYHFTSLLGEACRRAFCHCDIILEWWIMLYEPTLLLCDFYINNEFTSIIIIAYLKNKVKVILDCFLVLRFYTFDIFSHCIIHLLRFHWLLLLSTVHTWSKASCCKAVHWMKPFRAIRAFFTLLLKLSLG